MILSLHKIQSYFTISVVEVLCGSKSTGFVEVCVDESDARFLHKSNQRFLGNASNLAQFSSCNSSVNVRLQHGLFLCGMPFCHFVTGTSQNYRLNIQRYISINCNYNMHNTETLHVQRAIPVRMLTDWCQPPFDYASFCGWLWWAKLRGT